MDSDRPGRVLAGLGSFLAAGPASPADPRQQVVELFHRVAVSVPAYRAFLREHGVEPGEVRTFADFERLPLMTKENYHRRYPLPDLCRQGRLDGCDMVAVSSGSTGQPTFWPRSVTDELTVAARFEQVFAGSFAAAERTTLAVVCFPLGTWVGGLYTLACARHLAAKGYPITVVAPGNNKAEILRVIPELAAHCDQTVLLGYPPFIKDVIDTGTAAGLDWTRYAVKLVLAGEVFSEEWRDLVGRRAGMSSPCYDSASLYGTADAGVLGTETPLSICIRRFLAARPQAAQELFGEARLPTLVQYDPGSRFFETHDGTLLFSADSGVPLVRYHIADEGGLIGYQDMLAFCGQHGFDPMAELGGPGGGPGGGRRRARRTRGPAAAVRLRVRALALHGVLLRRQRVSGERCRRPGAAGRQRLGHRQVRARGGRRRRRQPASVRHGRARARRGSRRSPRARARGVDPRAAAAAEQRVRPLRAGRVPAAQGHVAAGWRPRVLPGRRQAPLHAGNERPGP